MAPAWVAADRSELVLRAVSGAVLAAIGIGGAMAGGWVFTALVAAVACIAVFEWHRIVLGDAGAVLGWIAGALLLAVIAAFLLTGVEISLTALVLAVMIYASFAIPAGGERSPPLWVLSFGLVYVAQAALAILWLRAQVPHGLGLIGFLFAVIWAGDIAAYLIGRSLGGARLMPGISPQKTWAGLFGGVVVAAVIGTAYASALDGMPMAAAILALLLAIVGQIGDLFESALKRRYNRKDSGRLIPGHGGVLDRIDALIAAAPILALTQASYGGASQWIW